MFCRTALVSSNTHLKYIEPMLKKKKGAHLKKVAKKEKLRDWYPEALLEHVSPHPKIANVGPCLMEITVHVSFSW